MVGSFASDKEWKEGQKIIHTSVPCISFSK